MNESQPYLFIGGPKHGETLFISPGMQTVKTYEATKPFYFSDPFLTEMNYETVLYHKQKLGNPKSMHTKHCFVVSNMSFDQALEALKTYLLERWIG